MLDMVELGFIKRTDVYDCPVGLRYTRK